MVAGRGHRLLRGALGGPAVEKPDGAPHLVVVEPVQVVAPGHAGLAAGAQIQVDVERVLLSNAGLGPRDELAVGAQPREELRVVVLLRETIDGGQDLLVVEDPLEGRQRGAAFAGTTVLREGACVGSEGEEGGSDGDSHGGSRARHQGRSGATPGGSLAGVAAAGATTTSTRPSRTRTG